MKALFRIIIMLMLGVLFVTGAFVAGYAAQQSAAPTITTASSSPAPVASASTSKNSLEQDFAVFWEVWGIVKSEFIGKIPDDEAMTAAAVSGVISVLDDQHTHYQSAKNFELRRFELDGSFEGIGATVDLQNGRVVIVAPLKGRPAEKAGLLAGDIVTKVDGKSIDGLSLDEVIGRIRGPKGTQVTLTVVRTTSATPIDLTITRATIETDYVIKRKLDDGLVYVQLTEFGAPASKKMDEALQELLKDNPKGLILDLRGNPGGYLSTAIEIGSEFIADGLLLSEVDKDGNKRTHQALKGGRAPKVPLVVLVDKGSASASELLSGAIKDHKRGTLIGETTFGKGSVQVSHELSDKSRLTVTVRHWLTPSGRDIHGQGIEPDIFVPRPTEADKKAGRDPQLERAVQFLLTGK